MFKKHRMEIFKRILSWGAWFSRAKIWLGFIVGGGILAWAARATDWLNQFSPFSWVFAFFLGILVLVWFSAGGARFYLWLSEAKYNIHRTEEPSVFNPLEDKFTKQIIRISDFGSPIYGKIPHKTFVECHLMGPAIIFMRKPNAINNTYMHCDWVWVPDNSEFKNVFYFESVSFENCTLNDITILIPESKMNAVESQITDLKWSNKNYVN